jgi:DNA-binding transcriptional regulator of glucitol operon
MIFAYTIGFLIIWPILTILSWQQWNRTSVISLDSSDLALLCMICCGFSLLWPLTAFGMVIMFFILQKEQEDV